MPCYRLPHTYDLNLLRIEAIHIQHWPNKIAFNPAKMNKVNLFETEHFFCDLYCLLSGQSQSVHSHDKNDKTYTVLQGELVVTLGTEEATLGPGDSVLAKAGVPHGIRNDSNEDGVSLVFMSAHPNFNK